MKIKLNNMRIRAFAFILGALFVSFIWVYISYLIPIGSVDGENIYKYEAMQRINMDNAVKSIGKDKAFDTAMKKLGITVSDSELTNEYNSVVEKYGGTDELKSIMIDTQSNMTMLKSSIKKGMLKQKAIEKLAKDEKASDDDLTAFYEQYKENYPGEFKENKEKIKSDYLMMKGAQRYDEYIKSYEDAVQIRIY